MNKNGINDVIFKIPRNVISNSFNLYNGNVITFGLGQYNIHLGNTRFKYYSLDSYTLSLTSSEEEQINNDSEKQLIGSIDSGVSNLNNNLNDFYNSFSNTNVDNTLITDFLDSGDSISIDDNTGVENFFNILYNSFCENSVVSVSFTIPFTNKTMIISSDNVSAFFPSSLKSIMSVFCYGAISLFILRDIRKMIDKTLEGNPENVSSDVKREVL